MGYDVTRKSDTALLDNSPERRMDLALVIDNKRQFVEDYKSYQREQISLEEMQARYGNGTEEDFLRKAIELRRERRVASTKFDSESQELDDCIIDGQEKLQENREEDSVTDDVLAKSAKSQERYRQEALGARRTAKALKSKAVTMDDILEAVKKVHIKLPVLSVAPPEPQARQSTVLTPVLLLSDLHVGTLHTGDGVVGRFDNNVFSNRVHRLTQAVLEITTALRAAHTVDKLVICWAGDNIEGRTIFDAQASQTIPMMDQFMFGTEVLANGLVAPLARLYPNITMLRVPGNHGRLGNKGQLHPTDDSLDLLWMEVLKLRCQDMPHIAWDDRRAATVPFTLHNWNFLLSHGDKNRGAARNPTAAAQNRARDYEDMSHSKIDVYLSGHLHCAGLTMQGYRYVVTNGSVPGTSPFGADLGLASPPIQTLITVSDRCPIQAHYLLQLATREECLTMESLNLDRIA